MTSKHFILFIAAYASLSFAKAQNKQTDSTVAAKTLNSLLSVCKNVDFADPNKITSDLLSLQGKSYLIMVDLFPSINLFGVEVGDRVYANGTWQIFELLAREGPEETFRVPFRKTMVQQLKVKIREM